MNGFLWFLLTLAAAAAGGLLLTKLRVPAGGMVGSMAAVVALNLAAGQAVFYPALRLVLQVCSGAMIGSRMTMAEVRGMKKLALPIVVLVACMLVLNVIFGMLIYSLSPLDAATSLFATAPGGASDMAIIAADLGANTGYVAILQLWRLLVIFVFMPPLFKWLLGRRAAPAIADSGKMLEAVAEDAEDAPPVSGAADPKKRTLPSWLDLLLLIASAAAGGILLNALRVTAGGIIGAMLAGGAYSVLRGGVRFPKPGKLGLQLFAGAFLGIQLDRASLCSVAALALPALIMAVGIFAFTFCTAFMLRRAARLDLATSLLSSTPGGVSEMSLLSEDLGADTAKIAVLQTSRLLLVVLLFPTMLKIVVALLS